MTKKLILLILALPLILMVCLFALTRTVGQAIEAPVTGIEIVGDDNIVYLDFDQDETHTLSYTLYPTNAKNKKITVSSVEIKGEVLSKLDYDLSVDGEVLITPRSAGAARVVLTTEDGAYADSVDIYVESSVLTAITSTAEKDVIAVGEKTKIQTTFEPAKPANALLSYTSSDPKVAKVSSAGVVTGVSRGEVTITVVSLQNEAITSSVTIRVENADVMDIADSVTSTAAVGSIAVSMDTDKPYDSSSFSCEVLLADGTPFADAPLTVTFSVEADAVSLTYEFTDTSFVGTLILRVSYTEDGSVAVVKDCALVRVADADFEISFENAKPSILVGQQIFLTYELTPDDIALELVSYEASSANLSITDFGGSLVLTGNRAGAVSITLTATTESGVTKSFTHDMIVLPKSIAIAEDAKTYGDEDVFAIGSVGADGQDSKHTLTLSTSSALGENFYEHFAFVPDSDKVYVDGDGEIHFNDSDFRGIVNFVARIRFGDVTLESAPFAVMCVADGIDVYSYLDLLYATENGSPAILHADIRDDFGKDADGNVVYTEIQTTYDSGHYQNLGMLEKAKVKVLLEFRDDLYGNGYTINAHNVAYGLDEAGALRNDALFRGPLNFVSMSETDGVISVKGQDNISFALYEGVSVRNVKLRGCDLQSDTDGNVDLADLEYVGTTVEVLGDNVNISYARISNGRTVLRAFGDAEDAEKEIHLNVNNSVLSGAREFVMRIGSNCFKTGTFEDPAPYLDGDDEQTNAYLTKQSYHRLTEEERAAYDESFIKTYVTVKNSVFEDAGLFAIGMDSHFAGAALADGSDSAITKYVGELLSSWRDLARTSYGAKLTFEGDVRMYTWKLLSDVDSSTLIKIDGTSSYADKMRFDVGEMIEAISANEQFANITYKQGDQTYVHAGIAFFGGGKNYSVFENKLDGDSKQWTLSGYTISFGDLQKLYLTLAAGEEDFYFLIHDTTSGFSPEEQAKLLASDKAYDCIKK